MECSPTDLQLQPSHTTEEFFAFVYFATNQLFIGCNVKDYSYSTTFTHHRITLSRCHKSFFIVVEVYLGDHVFITADDGFYSGYLLIWIKCVKWFEVIVYCLTILTIIECKSNCEDISPLHFCDGKFFEFLPAFVFKRLQVWNWWGFLNPIDYFRSNDLWASDDLLVDHLLCKHF